MRWIAFFLVLVNLTVFLLVQRLPETESPEPPPPNLPRVSMIELVDEPDPPAGAESQADGDCLALTGFVRPEAARDWARVQGLPAASYRVEPTGARPRPVFRVVSSSTGESESMRALLRKTLERGADAYLVEDSEGTRVQAGHSQSLSGARRIQRQVAGLSEEFALERDWQHLYSFALVAEDERLTAALEHKQGRTGSWLEVVRCETVANPRQNP